MGFNSRVTKKISFHALVLMILTTCLGIRWIPVAGSIGPSAIVFWGLGILLFFIPLSMMIIELSLNFDDNGGVYLWTKHGIGDKSSFLTAWFYWVNNLFYYPGLLTFIAANLAYLIGYKTLAANHFYIVSIVIIGFWGAVIINIMGMQKIAKLASLSGILSISLTLLLILAGFIYLSIYHQSATNFSLSSFIPQGKIVDNLSNLSLLMFALTGMELIPTIANSIDRPERNLPRAIIICSITLSVLYIIGTIAINLIMNPSELSNTTGLVDTVYVVSSRLHLAILAQVLITCLIVIEFAAVTMWLIGPTIMFFSCVEPGVLPSWLQTTKGDTPVNALILQGFIITILSLVTQFLPTVNSMYMVLILMATVISFLPYLFLSIAYLRLRKENKLKRTVMGNKLAYTVAIITFISVIFGICFSFMPTEDLKTGHDILIYELELAGGPILFIIVGLIFYARKKV